jgi:hypothetical protein
MTVLKCVGKTGSSPRRTWIGEAWFIANGGITDEQARQVLGDLIVPDAEKAEADRPTTLRLNLLAYEAHRRGLMSEGRLARLLRLGARPTHISLCASLIADSGEPAMA